MTMEVIKSSEGIGGFKQTLGNKQSQEIPREDMIYFHEYSPVDDLGGLIHDGGCPAIHHGAYQYREVFIRVL